MSDDFLSSNSYSYLYYLCVNFGVEFNASLSYLKESHLNQKNSYQFTDGSIKDSEESIYILHSTANHLKINVNISMCEIIFLDTLPS